MTKSIKIVNPLSGRRDCKLNYSGFVKQAGNLKAHKEGNFLFSFGDILRYIGYAETLTQYHVRGYDVVEDIPSEYESYIFNITTGVPCPNVPIVFYNLQTYKTLQIGTQCWLKENINTGTMIIVGPVSMEPRNP